MKNVVKCWKDFLSYFTTLETYRDKYVKATKSIKNNQKKAEDSAPGSAPGSAPESAQ